MKKEVNKLNESRLTIREDMEARISSIGKRAMLRRAVALMCALVMLFTMNTLKTEAVTMERIATCGMFEHLHDASCYDEAGQLCCGFEVEHQHTDACYQEIPVYGDTVLDEFAELNALVRLTTPMDADGEVVAGNVEPDPYEVPVEIQKKGLDDEPQDIPEQYGEEAPEQPLEYVINGNSAFIGDILNAVGLNQNDITAVGEVIDNVIVDNDHAVSFTVEPVEGVTDEFQIVVRRDFEVAELGAMIEGGIKTVLLRNGVALKQDLQGEQTAAPGEANAFDLVQTTEPEQTGDGENNQTEVGQSTENPIGEIPTVENQTAENPIGEIPTVENQTAENPIGEIPTVENQTAENPIGEIPTVEGQTVENQTAEENVGEEQTGSDQIEAGQTEPEQGEVQGTDIQQNENVQPAVDSVGQPIIVEETAPQTAEENVQEPADGNTEENVQQSADDNTEENVQQPADGTTEENVQQPADGTTEENVEESADGNTEENIQQPTEEEKTEEEKTEEDKTEEDKTEEEKTEEDKTEEDKTEEDKPEEDKTEEEKTEEEKTEEDKTEEEKTEEEKTEEDKPEEDKTQAAEGETVEAGDEETEENPDGTKDSDEAGDTVIDETEGETEEGTEGETEGEAEGETAPEALLTTLDFTDYVATAEQHTDYLYDATQVAVYVDAQALTSADGVTVETAPLDGEYTSEGDVTLEDGTLILRGNGVLVTEETTYVVTGLVMPVSVVENEGQITISTVDGDATLLNVEPVFEETTDNYENFDDLFALFEQELGEQDPSLIARLADLFTAHAEQTRKLQMKMFNIGLQDSEGGEQEPGTTVHVQTSLPQAIEGEGFRLYHIVDNVPVPVEGGVVVDENNNAVGFDFYIDSLSPFALVYYTVEYITENNEVTVKLDFKDIVENGVDFDANSVISALNDGIAVSIASLEQRYAEGGDGVVEGELYIDYTASENTSENVTNADWAGFEVVSADEGLTVADGQIIVTGDGAVVLSDEVSTINIVISGYQKTVQKVLGDGATIEALDGDLPMGASAEYADLPSEKAAELAETYGLKEDTENAEVGFSAFGVSVTTPEGEVPVNGTFAVTVPHNVDVPENAKVTYELFHIHEVDGVMTAEKVENATVEEGKTTFVTNGFSEYLIRYTVDFHYNGVDYSIPGNTQILLTQLIEIMHITKPAAEVTAVDVETPEENEVPENSETPADDQASDNEALLDIHDVASVEFTDAHLVQVDQVSGLVTINGTDGERADVDAGDYNFLLSSLEPFSTDEKLTITLKDGTVIEVGVTDDQELQGHNVIVNLYEEDGFTLSTDYSALEQYRYIIVERLYTNEDKNNPIGYRYSGSFKAGDLNGCTYTFSQNFTGLNHGNPTGQEVIYDEEDHTISVRLYQVSMYNSTPWGYGFFNDAKDSIDGYTILGHGQGNVTVGNTTTLTFKKSYVAKYQVEVYGEDGVNLNGLTLNVKVDHQSSNSDTYTETLSVGSNSTYVKTLYDPYGDPVQSFNSWSGQALTGNESRTVAIQSNGTEIANGGLFNVDGNVYQVTYSKDAEDDTSVPGQETTVYKDIVNIRKVTVGADYDIYDILGPGMYYGISVDKFNHSGHLQSNFATNYYKGSTDGTVQPDLASAGDEAATGVVAAAHIEGTMSMNCSPEKGIVMTLVDASDKDKVIAGGGTGYVVVESTSEAISNNIVNPILNHGSAMSQELLSHAPTIDVDIPAGNFTIDLTVFPENAVIYLDGDALADKVGKTQGEVFFNTNQGQIVVLNYANSESVEIRLQENNFMVNGNSSTKEYMAEHLVFNMANATTVNLYGANGIFLAPRADAQTTIVTSTEGWLISGGTLNQAGQGSEWHLRTRKLKKATTANTNFAKTVDDKSPTKGEVFEFEVYQYNPNTDSWVLKDTITNRGRSITYSVELDEGRLFKVKEKGKAANTYGDYTIDEREYYVYIRYISSNGVTVAATPEYYDNIVYAKAALNGDADAADHMVSGITFQNGTVKGGLNITKEVIGTDERDKNFTFELDVWNHEADDETDPEHPTYAYTGVISGTKGGVPWKATGSDKSEGSFTEGANSYDTTKVTFTLKAGETLNINSLPVGTHYAITEVVSGTDMPEGYTYIKATKTQGENITTVNAPEKIISGSIPESEEGSVTVAFTNKYISAKTNIEGTKEFTNGTIAANQFSFTLSGGDGHLPNPSTVYSDTEGNITFGDMTYELSDLDDVTADANGKKTKVFTYTLTEVVPAGVTKDNPVSGGIQYDTHSEEIKVTVVYDTATHVMTATPDKQKTAVHFTNEKMGSLEVTKHVQLNDEDCNVTENKRFTFGLYKWNSTENEWEAVQHEVDSQQVNWTETITVAAGSATGTATFSPITVGEKYRVYELDEDKTIRDGGYFDGYTVTYSNDDGVDITLTETNRTTTVTNNRETTEVKVRKTWGAGQAAPEGAKVIIELSGTSGNPASTVNLKALNITPISITLNGGEAGGYDTAAKPWEYVWTNLPKNDAQGNEITYTTTEKEYWIDENKIDISATGMQPVTTDESATVTLITNKVPTVDIEVNKAWVRGEDHTWPADVASVTVTLYSKVGSAEPTAVDPAKTLIITQANSAATAEKVAANTASQATLDERIFKDLPKYDTNGKLITYSVVETAITPVSGKTVALTDFVKIYSPEDTTTGGLITVTNKGDVPEKEITVKKVWKKDVGGNTTDLSGAELDGLTIEYQIMQKAWLDAAMTMPARDDVAYKTPRTLPVTNGTEKVWEETVKQLPGQGKENITAGGTTEEKVVYYSYYVVEQASDYNAKIELLEANGTGADEGKFVFTNKVTEIEITKIWYDVANQPTQWINNEDYPLSFTLKRVSGQKEQTATVTVNAKGNGTVTVTGTAPFDTSKITGTLTKPTGNNYNQGYKIKLTNLPFTSTETDPETSKTTTYEWTYKMVENVPEGYTPTYQDANGDTKTGGEAFAVNGETIINTPITYAMPSTGGRGTSMFYIIGSILTLLAAVLLITKRRTDGQGID